MCGVCMRVEGSAGMGHDIIIVCSHIPAQETAHTVHLAALSVPKCSFLFLQIISTLSNSLYSASLLIAFILPQHPLKLSTP